MIVLFFTAIFLLIGYTIMDRIDIFIERDILHGNDVQSYKYTKYTKNKILIYGENALSKEVTHFLHSQKYTCITINNIHDICSEDHYFYLLVLSDNDVDNLMLSSIAMKLYHISHVIALCNLPNNLKFYNDFNFDMVLLNDVEGNNLLFRIKGAFQNAVKVED